MNKLFQCLLLHFALLWCTESLRALEFSPGPGAVKIGSSVTLTATETNSTEGRPTNVTLFGPDGSSAASVTRSTIGPVVATATFSFNVEGTVTVTAKSTMVAASGALLESYQTKSMSVVGSGPQAQTPPTVSSITHNTATLFAPYYTGLVTNYIFAVTPDPVTGQATSRTYQSTSPSVTLGGLQQDKSYSFTVQAGNEFGYYSSASPVITFATLLDPDVDSDGDGIKNGWEQTYGLNPRDRSDAQADIDNDGFTNLQEFERNTDPIRLTAGVAGSNYKPDSLVSGTDVTFSVDNNGSASTAIPLEIPPGRGGMQPSPSLVYNSGGGNGVVGVGWSFSTGFPQAITRGRSIFARDGVVRGMNYTREDRFYLDGRRLICVSGEYGAPNSTYRCEVDDFSEISAKGTGSEIDSWVVKRKDGKTLMFGQTSDSRQFSEISADSGLANVPREYALNEVSDTAGNSVVLEYTNCGSGEYVLRSIVYTKGAQANGPSAQHTIAMRYNQVVVDGDASTMRADRQVFYGSRRTQQATQRLDSVEVSSAFQNQSAVVGRWDLVYHYSAATSRTRLASIHAYASRAQDSILTALPPIVLEWTDAKLGFSKLLDYTEDNRTAWGDYYGTGFESKSSPLPYPNDSARINYQSRSVDYAGNGVPGVATFEVKVPQNAGTSDGKITVSGPMFPQGSLDLTRHFGNPLAPGSDPNPERVKQDAFSGDGMGVLGGITFADFNCDGRDDMLVHEYTGKLILYESTGSGFSEGRQVGKAEPRASFLLNTTRTLSYEESRERLHYLPTWTLKPMPCDINGDGRTDYVFLQKMRTLYAGTGQNSDYSVLRLLLACLSLPDPGDPSRTVLGPPQLIWRSTSVLPGHPDSPVLPPAENGGWGPDNFIMMGDVFSGAEMGDFNGDGLTDFICLDNSESGGRRWRIYYSKGAAGDARMEFSMYVGALPNSVTLTAPGGQRFEVETRYKPMTTQQWTQSGVSWVRGAVEDVGTGAYLAEIEGCHGFANMGITDVNGDGISDFFWYARMDRDDQPLPASLTGWWVMHGTGNPNAAFSGPKRLTAFDAFPKPPEVFKDYGSRRYYFQPYSINHGFDMDGDGHRDWEGSRRIRTLPDHMQYTFIFRTRSQDGVSAAEFPDLLAAVKGGLGTVSRLVYRAAKSRAIYTKGPDTFYPIRNVFGSNPVVSDLFKDSGGATPAQFSYQYSGNRLDLSGRGSLGFHSFVTLDRQTNLFKYQFLAQSFPMTGLTAREQTYRYWESGAGTTADPAKVNFRFISSHDNTVVFDEVVNGASPTQAWGTVYPYISQAVESRWEDAPNPHFTFTKATAAGTPGSSPEPLFAATRPDGAHITISAQSWFDEQNQAESPQVTLPGLYKASDAAAYSATATSTNNAPVSFLSVASGPSTTVGATVTVRTSITDDDDSWIGRHLYIRSPTDTGWVGWAFEGVSGDPTDSLGAAERDRAWNRTLNQPGVWQFLLTGYDNQGPGNTARWGNNVVASVTVTDGSNTTYPEPPPVALPSVVNAVTGYASYAAFDALTFPRKITYGNLRRLRTDFGGGFAEDVVTTYHSPAQGEGDGLTGLVKRVATTVDSPLFGREPAPLKHFTYWKSTATNRRTPLVETETVDANRDDAFTPGAPLDLKTTTTRDSLGRVTQTRIDGSTTPGDQFIGGYIASRTDAFDARFDLPTETKNAEPYLHRTATAYHPVLGVPTEVTDVNGAKVITDYDALGRPIKVTDALRGLATRTEYAFTTTTVSDWKKTQTVAPPPGHTGVAPGAPITGVTGLTIDSAFATRVNETLSSNTTPYKLVVSTYYDRLGRAIRTVKEGFGSQSTYTDTAYNTLGQVVAVSLPYTPGSTPLWTRTNYDALGRVVTVIAPNGTVTTSSYIGRATKVTVDAPSLGGVDPAPQTNTTFVDFKGRTVKVWNNDNDPGALDPRTGSTVAPSIEFLLDGFGRMRSTRLKGQTRAITATYDALGRQLTLDDPDKGLWTYINNALGQVVRQTDAKTNVTVSTFDRLGRPLKRTTTEPASGPVETARWFYYDTAAASAANPALQLVDAAANRGWIGAPQHDEVVVTGAPGFAAAAPTHNVAYYDDKGRPFIALTTIDGKFFYTYTGYDAYSRPSEVRHYWRPATLQDNLTQPYVWQDWGYRHTYDAKGYLLKVTDTSALQRTWWEADPASGYDYLDRPVLVRKGAGHWTRRTYRPEDGVLTAITTGPRAAGTAVTGSVQNHTYTWDGLGNLVARANGAITEGFTYDNLNRLRTGTQGTAATYQPNGNLATKTDVADGTLSGYTYDAARPHAVTAATYSLGGQTSALAFTYDANGNLATRTRTAGATTDTWDTRWPGFDKPRWLTKQTAVSGTLTATTGAEFHYNADRSRTLHLDYDAVGATRAPSHYTRKKIYALGSTVELDYSNETATGPASWRLDKVRLYVPGPEGLIGAMEFAPHAPFDRAESALVYHQDHLGSIDAITPWGVATAGAYIADGQGKPGRYSYEAWGERRDPLSWRGKPQTTADGGPDDPTPRGYTGHEMLDELGLVHMNGRVYDGTLGRFLSADILVQAPGNLQSFNRYSYVFNNPLSFTDPSGFETIDDYGKKIQKLQRQYVAAAKKYEGQQLKRRPQELGKIQARIDENTAAIRHIVEVAAGMNEILGIKNTEKNLAGLARGLDDDDSDFKSIDRWTTFFDLVPGGRTAKAVNNGQVGSAIGHFALDVAVTELTLNLGSILGKAGAGAAAKATTNGVETVTARLEANAAGRLAQMEAANPGAHFVAKHGAQTTIEQQFVRATTGVAPDGSVGKSAVDSSRFLTNRAMLAASQRAEAIFAQTGQKSFSFEMSETIGEGFTKGGGSLVRTTNVTAKFWNGRLGTMFPELDPLP